MSSSNESSDASGTSETTGISHTTDASETATLVRCPWAGNDEEYQRYHDDEWGWPLHGDQPLFEKLCLEGFQAGLSWITILKRRAAFREVFQDFDPAMLVEFGPDDVDKLMSDARIIRNRAKIVATIGNAKVTRDLIEAEGAGALDRLMWSFASPRRTAPPASAAEVPALSEESTALSAALKKLGFRFVGPTTMYALMQSSGMVDDHIVGCWRAGS